MRKNAVSKFAYKTQSIFVLLIGIDQISKFVVNKNYPNLVVRNRGVAFGFFQNEGLFISVIGIILLLIFLYKNKISIKLDRMDLKLLLVLSGAISNVLDRIFCGYIVDFINLKFAVVNLADLFISMGIFFLIFTPLIERMPQKE